MAKKTNDNIPAGDNPPIPGEINGDEIPKIDNRSTLKETGYNVPADSIPPASEGINGSKNEDEKLIHLVICADSSSADIVKAVWDKHCNIDNVVVISPELSIRELLEDCIADNKIAQKFVLIPANTIPCSQISFEELQMPVVYIGKDNKEQFNHHLPMYFDKVKLVEYLTDTEDNGEAFVKGYVDRYCSRPMQVGFRFGNYVTPVMRGNPCENIVIEGLLKRKFITASEEGFAAIKNLINHTLLK